MKNFISILLASALCVSAQTVPISTGTNANDHSGEIIGRGTWTKLNYNFAYLTNQLATLQTSNATLNAQIAALTNGIQTSQTFSLLSSNFFVFNGSNYIGNFTNLFSLTDTAQRYGTNVSLTNMMDAGSGWIPYYLTNPIVASVLTNIATNQTVTNILTSTPFYTTNAGIVTTNYFNVSSLGTNFNYTTNVFTNYNNGGIKLAVLSPSFNTTGAVSVASVTPFSAVGRLNTFAGQTIDFSNATISNPFGNATLTNLAILIPGGTNHLNIPASWVNP